MVKGHTCKIKDFLYGVENKGIKELQSGFVSVAFVVRKTIVIMVVAFIYNKPGRVRRLECVKCY